jgi:hypothetical protein
MLKQEEDNNSDRCWCLLRTYCVQPSFWHLKGTKAILYYF